MKNRSLILWLGLCCAMIFIMALIGAVTRLTESGLSITRWEPVKGALPPLSDTDWQKAFDLYRATPQYKAINQGMALDDFKHIFFWEWLHRLWGRLIGLVYAAGLAFFWLRKKIPPGFKAPLGFALLLGGVQGLVGWLMVKSGLQPGMAAVSAYGLAAHLSLALGLYGFLFIQLLRLWPMAPVAMPTLRVHARAGLVLLCLAMIWGVFTAGLDAGKIYNSFPLMDGHVMPPDFAPLQPFWRNLFENPASVQFVHRVLTISTAVILLWLAVRLYPRSRKIALGLGVMSVLQPALGILTLLTGVNIFLAAAHQAGAIVLLTFVLAAVYGLEARNAKTR